MATVSKWNPFGVALDITATGSTVTRTAANKYTVKINASWETYYSGGKTNYGMTASSGGGSATINKFGTSSSGGSGSFTGTYSISGNGSATKTVTVTFKNFNTDNGDSATKNVSFNVTVPAWTSYTVSYNANGGAGAPSNQTKWKDQTLTLSTTKPTRTGYSFLGWATSSTATSATYAAGASYTANAAATLYAVWKANTYTVSYNANGGTGAPANQTKTYGKTLTLSSTKPTRENYNFLGWGTSASATTVAYAAGASYTGNAALTLYAIWELAYTKPRITNLTVERHNTTSALVKFSWACDQPLSVIGIYWSAWDLSDAGGVKILTADEEINPVSVIVGDSALNPETSYNFQVVVVDSGGSSEATKTLYSEKYIVDFSPYGVAFGKASEEYNTVEFAYDANFKGAVCGRALGMDSLPAIPESSDFNDYITTGCYAVHSNAVAATCGNIPVARAGRLEVWSATGEGVRAEQWSYLRQRYIPYNSDNAVWERDITRGEDNVWRFYEWYRSSLTPDISNKIYNKSAITVGLTANISSLTTGAYTEIAFNKTISTMGNNLELGFNSIIIGADVGYVKASAQILLKCLSQGSKHFKINKISNGTTTSYTWICQEVNPIKNASGAATATGVEFCMPPIIIPVKENDIINCTYYTSNSTDYIVSGSAAGGAQTYLTVEEL